MSFGTADLSRMLYVFWHAKVSVIENELRENLSKILAIGYYVVVSLGKTLNANILTGSFVWCGKTAQGSVRKSEKNLPSELGNTLLYKSIVTAAYLTAHCLPAPKQLKVCYVGYVLWVITVAKMSKLEQN